MPFPKPYADIVARLRVPSGLLIIVVFAWLSHPTLQSLLYGLPVALIGLALRAWAAGCLAKNLQLSSSGPYAYTRNPLYLGTYLMAVGVTLAVENYILLAALSVLYAVLYHYIILDEETKLERIFGSAAAPGGHDNARRHTDALDGESGIDAPQRERTPSPWTLDASPSAQADLHPKN